ncbi:D-aspartate oxidase isoform X2 [Ambystoma mexicanum]|uniref:D-aspartate oxidase isoform X2 n=1 Tax=Ambystoma mexicanum TaxID=8296 RepID=UPI0037E9A5C2
MLEHGFKQENTLQTNSWIMCSVKVAIIGGGLVGLSTAVCISESIPQCSVTVIAERFSPDTTSDVAAGVLIPHTFPGTPVQQQMRWFQETFDYLLSICNSAEAADAGILLLSGCQIFKNAPEEKYPFWSDVVLGFRLMTDKELVKFPRYVFGQAFTTLKCDCPPYLLWLEKRLKRNGGHVHAGKIQDLWDLHGQFDIVVNCSGLGSRELLGDMKVYPVQGQVLKVQAPWLTHFIRDGTGSTYIYPGISNVTLGGTRVKDTWSLAPDASVSKEIFDRCCALEPSLQVVKETKERVGLRPTRTTVRVEKEVLLQNGRRLNVVHNYGHGGGGFSVHRGTAKEATHLVGEFVNSMRSTSTKSKL